MGRALQTLPKCAVLLTRELMLAKCHCTALGAA